MLLSSKINLVNSILENDTVVIEGIKDRKALEKFGVSNLMEISGKSLLQVADMIVAKNISSVAILTDFDEDGKSKNYNLLITFHNMESK